MTIFPTQSYNKLYTLFYQVYHRLYATYVFDVIIQCSKIILSDSAIGRNIRPRYFVATGTYYNDVTNSQSLSDDIMHTYIIYNNNLGNVSGWGCVTAECKTHTNWTCLVSFFSLSLPISYLYMFSVFFHCNLDR